MASMAFTSLAAPTHEDNMEMSSPAANDLYDGDIDLDIPFADTYPEDERMLEDGEPLRPGTADEEMGDDEQTLVAPVTEEEMQDGPLDFSYAADDQQDEDLIDYDDGFVGDPQDTTLNNAQDQNIEGSFGAPTEAKQVDEEIIRQPEPTTTIEKPIAPSVEQAVDAVPQQAPANVTHDEVNVETQTESGDAAPSEATATQTAVAATDAEETAGEPPAAEGEGDSEDEVPAFAEEAEAAEYPEDDETVHAKPPPQLPGTLDTSLSHVPEGPPTPTDTGLHPMTIKFLDHEMPLFKSQRQLDGLLKDDNLANVSLADLLQNCRQRLLIKIGDNCVTTQQDLVLHFEQLHLFINENSHCASVTSLNDVLDVFNKFHENADVDVPPLFLFLQAQPNFTNSMNALKQAAADGRSLSEVFPSLNGDAATNQEEEYGDQYDEESYEEGHEYHDGGNDQPEEENAEQYDAQDFVAVEDQTEESADHDDTQQHGEEASYQEEEHHEYQQELEETVYDGLGPIPDPEEDDLQYEETAPDQDSATALLENLDQDRDAQETAQVDAEASQPATEGASNVVHSDPTAIPAAAADTSADGTTGEYDPEELIDWDDDDLTDTPSETLSGDGNDDAAALLPVDDGDDAEAPKAADAHDNAAQEFEEFAEPQDDELGLNFESEDFLNADYAEYPAEAEGEAGQDSLGDEYDQAGEQFAQDQEDVNGQADNLDFENDASFQPGEDSEQFHTAYDLLEGDNHEPTVEKSEHVREPEAQPYYDEDDIGYEDDEDLNANPVSPAAGTSNSPLGKRSFEEHADEDELNFDEPELKKPRSD